MKRRINKVATELIKPNEPRMQFKCPTCSTPGDIPFPDGEVVNGLEFVAVVFKTEKYLCPGCLGRFVTWMHQVRQEGQIWMLRGYEIPKTIKQ